jgi:hypothetical protein
MHTRLLRRISGSLGAASVLMLIMMWAVAPMAGADSIGPITFEPPQYHTGDINGQNGWMKLNPLYDVAVAPVASYPAASGYGFGTQALQVSNFFVSGSFGDQTFSPGLVNQAGESGSWSLTGPGGTREKHFDASFLIGTTQATEQRNSYMSVSPDRGDGARMSYLRFEDHTDGVHVFFDDVTDPGPFPTVATFNETDIATLGRARSHRIRFSIDLRDGPGNDVARIYIDGKKKITGTTWEDYYRYDPEQAPTNHVPTIDKLLFREGGTQGVDNSPSAAKGQGFLVDRVSLASGRHAEDQGDDEGGDGENGGHHGEGHRGGGKGLD